MNFKIVSLGDYLKGKEVRVVHGQKVIHRHNGRLVVSCVYCKKSGLAYDGVAPCPVCRGKKKNAVKEPVVTCAFCKGTGSSSGTHTVCRVCSGKGLVHIAGPVEKCPECKGRGKVGSTDLMCIKCKGKGVIAGERPI